MGWQFFCDVDDVTNLELFKFCSLSDFLICRSGVPIAWKSIRQNQTAVISCKAEIVSTNECSTKLQSLKYFAHGLLMVEAYDRSKIYNGNKYYVQWDSTVTTKYIKHLNISENMVRKFHQSKDVEMDRVPEIFNPSDTFIQ